MQKQLLFASLFLCMTITSCGSFGEGLLAGLAGMGNSYGGGYSGVGFTSMPGTTGGNMDYLLDPNYAVAQTMAQQAQYNQVFNATVTQTANQVLSQEEQEYQNFCRYNKKSDGTNYTKSEWRAMKGQAIQNMNSSTSVSTNSSNSTVNSGSSSSGTGRRCAKLSVSDIAHCNGSGVCQKCNGNKKYYDNTFGNGRWVDPCITCHGTGKCTSCHETGYR